MAFHWQKLRSKRSSAQTITDADYAGDIALLANIPGLAESRLHSLKKAAGDIDLYAKADKTEYMCFNQNQKGDISALKGGSLKRVDKFTYLGKSVSSTKNDIDTQLAKEWNAIDWLSVIWRSDVSDK